MEIIGGGLAFAILLFIVLRDSRSEHNALFYDRQCGYCDMQIYFDKRSVKWIHEDGQLRAESVRHPGLTHPANPFGGM